MLWGHSGISASRKLDHTEVEQYFSLAQNARALVTVDGGRRVVVAVVVVFHKYNQTQTYTRKKSGKD